MKTKGNPPGVVFGPGEAEEARRLIRLALDEDATDRDITSEALIPPDAMIRGAFVPRRQGVICGLPVVMEVLRAIDPGLDLRALASDGEAVKGGQPVLEVRGPARPILAGERTALNFLQRLSGIATMTRRWNRLIRGTGAVLFDTRKTLPGWRRLEKYAVRTGGGANHRLSLSDQALVKDNHVHILRSLGIGGVQAWVEAVRLHRPGTVVAVEVETLEEFRDAVDAGADLIILDNMELEVMEQAVRELRARPGRRPLLEASGGIDARTLGPVARTGVDRISSGALTHSPPALDIGFDLLEVSRDDHR